MSDSYYYSSGSTNAYPSPVEASSGQTHRHRLSRGGDRAANDAAPRNRAGSHVCLMLFVRARCLARSPWSWSEAEAGMDVVDGGLPTSLRP